MSKGRIAAAIYALLEQGYFDEVKNVLRWIGASHKLKSATL